MTDTIGPFDSSTWSDAQWNAHMATAMPSGVIGSPASAFGSGSFAFSASGLAITLANGSANVGSIGIDRTGSSAATTATSNGSATQSRRDRIVLRRDQAAKTLGPVIITGTPSGSPVAPAITRSSTVFDEPMFSFLVPPNNGTTITSVIDERVWIDPSAAGRVAAYAAAARTARSDAGLLPGARIYESSTKRDYQWDGSAWTFRPTGYYGIVTGTSTQTITSGNSNHNAITLGTTTKADGITASGGGLVFTAHGMYTISGTVTYTASGTNQRFMASMQKNGTLIPESQNRSDPSVNNTDPICTATLLVEFDVNDTLQLSTRQDTGSGQDVDRTQCALQAHLVAAL